MSDLGHYRTFAPQKAMSALPPLATAKANSRKRSCPLYPESGRVRRKPSCLLWANSGHPAFHSIISSARASSDGGAICLSSSSHFPPIFGSKADICRCRKACPLYPSARCLIAFGKGSPMSEKILNSRGVTMRRSSIFILVALLVSTQCASSAELKIFTARAIWTVLNEVGPEFERTTGHRLNVISGFTPEFIKQMDSGGDVRYPLFSAAGN